MMYGITLINIIITPINIFIEYDSINIGVIKLILDNVLIKRYMYS